MNQVFTLGETIFDIIFKNNEPQAGRAGGSMLNTSVSLGRLNVPVSFISEFGIDNIGTIIDDFLKNNNVNTEFISRYPDGKTPLAIAMLDKQNNAHYDFYKPYPAQRLKNVSPDFSENDILLFGSSYALAKEVHENVKTIVETARQKKAIVIYDPNIRPSYKKDIPDFEKTLDENLKNTDLLRCSDEDISNAFQINNPDDFCNFIKHICPTFIYTTGKNRVLLRTPIIKRQYEVPDLEPESTIGAGDTFNAGLIFGLRKHKVSKKDMPLLPAEKWDDIIFTAIEFATHVCMTYDNYISKDFAKKYID